MKEISFISNRIYLNAMIVCSAFIVIPIIIIDGFTLDFYRGLIVSISLITVGLVLAPKISINRDMLKLNHWIYVRRIQTSDIKSIELSHIKFNWQNSGPTKENAILIKLKNGKEIKKTCSLREFNLINRAFNGKF